MPTNAEAPPVKRGRGRPRKQHTLPAQIPMPTPEPEPAPEAARRQLDGVDILEIAPLAPLGPNKPMRIVKIHLADGRVLHGCRDCPDELDFVGGRGDVMAHRNAVHGARFGKGRIPAPAAQEKLPEVLDAVLSPRHDGTPAPDSVYEMTVGEVLSLMPTIQALGDLVELAETERDALRAQLKDFKSHEREWRTKIEGYDTLRDEVTELRQQLRQQGNYDQIKTELYALKAWKKKVIARFTAVGFNFTEED